MYKASYINHGGIGLTTDADGALNGLAGNEMRSLSLRDDTGAVIAHQTPSTPWTFESVTKALDDAFELVHDHLPVDVYLGDVFLGSTEL